MGEILVDFISTEVSTSLSEASSFTRYVGGQAANLAMNMSRLGFNSAVAACVGYDGLGQYARDQIRQSGVHTTFIQTTREAPTTIASITRQTQTPDFIIHRGADAFLRPSNELTETVSNSSIVHTSAFALSREPARTTILAALQTAHDAGRKISLDPNFDTTIWPDSADFVDILKETFQLVDFTKPSLEDCSRIFGPRNTAREYAHLFLDWGAKTVLISRGDQGVFFANTSGDEYEISAHEDLHVVDVTGAGDAYWAGFLAATLNDLPDLKAACIGQAVAELKISQIGPLEMLPDWHEIQDLAADIDIQPAQI